jgi:uncharacterized protein (TIGR03435 family)
MPSLAPLALLLTFALPLTAQVLAPTTGPRPSFDVTVVKPSTEQPQGAKTEGEQTRLVVNAKLLIQMAYGPSASATRGPDLQVLNGPGWIDDTVYDILAKIDPATFAAMQAMNRSQRTQQRQLMEQSLLADRFKLKVHTETRDQPVYALTLSKGPRPRPSATTPTDSATIVLSPGGTSLTPETLRHGILVVRKGTALEMVVKAMTIDAFVHALATCPELAGRAVLDQTGLAGAYDFTLDWTPESSPPPPPSADSSAPPSPDSTSDAPPLFTAIQQQLGLKLIPSKGPAQVIVIDHIERPSEN